ncbi:MAG: hypothetical protein M3134_01765 [Actinomycetota bacterium]|nr:hypothetical protein [Actinomycetota bacterium]
MTPRQRIVLLAIAAVVLVAGIALAASSGGDGDGGDQASAPTAPQTVQTTGPGEKPEPEEDPQPRMEVVRVRDGGPAGGVKTFRYERGETIRLRFAADEPGEVHIHGFDREVGVGPGGDKIVNFKADLEGIFEIEDHESGELLAKLEIRPK